MEKDELIKKYKGKILGFSEYAKPVRNYYVDNFIDKDQLIGFLYDLAEHEGTFTVEGFHFVEQYYGLDNLVEIISKENSHFQDQMLAGISIKDWLLIKKQYAIEYS